MATKPLPPHGTRARYLRGCHCDACRAANYRYLTRYRLDRERGTRRRVDAEAPRRHAQTLYDAGWTTNQIAEAAGCAPTAISRILRGAHATIRADIAARIFAARPSLRTVHVGFVPAIGTIRRIQALMVLGHPLASIAEHAGMHPSPLGHVLNGHRRTVTTTTATKVARAYNKLSRVPGTSVRARNHAANRGWHGPLAWDDNIDDPQAKPDTDTSGSCSSKSQQLAAARAADIQHLARFGIPTHEIAARVGVTPEYVRAQLRGHRVPGQPRTRLQEAA
ncbi:helix-turn-helix domain-containing protein [Streptomyces albus]|uniref:helix-turn-helix domain-containing protein n=1 Tax=Streptomyces albus TaxID=1888 RepID=UPI0033D94D20